MPFSATLSEPRAVDRVSIIIASVVGLTQSLPLPVLISQRMRNDLWKILLPHSIPQLDRCQPTRTGRSVCPTTTNYAVLPRFLSVVSSRAPRVYDSDQRHN